MCQIRKTKIKVKDNIIVYADACKAANLIADNKNNKINNITDSNNKANINSANVNLIKFEI